MNEPLEVETDPSGFSLELHLDDSNDFNPLIEFDSFGTLVCWHRRSNLGHKNITYQEELVDIIPKDAIKLPVYLLEHSGQTISLEPFNDPWDSGQVGWIFVTREKALEEYSAKKITPKIRERVLAAFRGEIETYDAYLRGEVYGYVVRSPEGDNLDSCWGFFGESKYCMEEGRASLRAEVENRTQSNEIERGRAAQAAQENVATV